VWDNTAAHKVGGYTVQRKEAELWCWTGSRAGDRQQLWLWGGTGARDPGHFSSAEWGRQDPLAQAVGAR